MSEETKPDTTTTDSSQSTSQDTSKTDSKTDSSTSDSKTDSSSTDSKTDGSSSSSKGDSKTDTSQGGSQTSGSKTDSTSKQTSTDTTNKKQYTSTGVTKKNSSVLATTISKKSAVTTNTAVTDSYKSKELDKTPLYTPYVATYGKTRTEGGEVTQSDVATLKRYYSSIDAEIYFGNQYIEDICDIQWQLNQNHLPIFGYNSYTYDELAVGSRIIQGSFSIRFTTPNYLFKVLENLSQLKATLNSSYKTQSHDRNVGEPQGSADETTKGLVYGTKTQERWPQTFDIDIIYGKPEKGFREVHVILQDVRIISCVSGASASSPVPVTETYSFVAHDIKTLA